MALGFPYSVGIAKWVGLGSLAGWYIIVGWFGVLVCVLLVVLFILVGWVGLVGIPIVLVYFSGLSSWNGVGFPINFCYASGLVWIGPADFAGLVGRARFPSGAGYPIGLLRAVIAGWIILAGSIGLSVCIILAGWVILEVSCIFRLTKNSGA